MGVSLPLGEISSGAGRVLCQGLNLGISAGNDLVDLFGRSRAPEIKALDFLARGRVEEFKLLKRLHAFGEHGYVQALAQPEHGPDDHRGLFSLAEMLDKLAVDLDFLTSTSTAPPEAVIINVSMR